MGGERVAFELLWLGARLRSHAPLAPHPFDIGAPRYRTLVLRLPPSVDHDLADAFGGLIRLRPKDYRYPAGSLHVTVRNFDHVAADHFEREAVDGWLGSIASGLPPIRLSLVGSGVSRDTVFVRADPIGRGLERLRHAVDASLGAPRSRRPAFMGRMAFANVIRFTESGPDPAYLRAVSSLRHYSFGAFEADLMELVYTDKVLSAAGTRLLAGVPLR